MSRAVSIGSLTGTLSHHPSRFIGDRSGGARKDAPGLGHDALGPEPEEAEDEQTDRDPLQRGNQVGRPDVEAAQQPGDLFEPDRHEQRAENGAQVVAPSPDDRKSTRLNSSHMSISY